MPKPTFSFYSPAEDRTLLAYGIKRWVRATGPEDLKDTQAMLVGAIPFDTDQPAALFEPESWEFVPGRVEATTDGTNPPAVEDVPFTQKHWDSFGARVAETVEHLSQPENSLRKVVLARLAAWTPEQGSFDAQAVHDRLADLNPHAYSYYLDEVPAEFATTEEDGVDKHAEKTALVGASPELVLRATPTADGCEFRTWPLAGSLPQSQAQNMTAEEIDAALFTEKNLVEHSFVTSDIAEVLGSFDSEFDLPERPAIVRTPRVLHLGTCISGTAHNTTMADVLFALHPTPAVSGYPQKEARAFLSDISVFARGLFSGVVGWIDTRPDSQEGCEWAMTLRGGLISPSRAIAFAGAGIVEDSVPMEELLETRAKLSTFAAALDCSEPPSPQFYPEEFIKKYTDEGLWIGQTFQDFFRDSFAAHADREALVARSATGTQSRLTYAELEKYAARISRLFADANLVPGDRVILHFPNTAEYAGALAASFMSGLVPIFSLIRHTEDNLAAFVESSGAKAILTVPRFLFTNIEKKMEAVTAAAPTAQVIFIPSPEDDSEPLESSRLYPNRDPHGLGLIQLSGGTTGTPKLIPRTHDDYLYSVRASAEICGLSPQDRLLLTLPAAHNFSMSSPGILGIFHAGGCVILNADPTPSSVANLVATERATVLPLVPPMLMSLLSTNEKTPIAEKLESLRFIQVGGAKLVETAARRVRSELGVQLQQVFGMAEGLVCYTRPEDTEDITTTTQGRPISAADEVQVRDDEGNLLPVNTPGNLWVRGPYTFRGYLNLAPAAQPFDSEGFYCSGDIVRQLPSGHLIVEGRAKDHINRGGEKVSAEELENHLLALPQVRDAVAIGAPDEVLGERIVVFLLTDHVYSLADTRAFLSSRGVPDFQMPDEVRIIDHLPSTAVGKVSRKELRTILADLKD
ncbi:MAG: AMP-binding protein [Corynebacterium sp.]|nr:AMP-binding protein [Corynebacterium sp.]